MCRKPERERQNAEEYMIHIILKILAIIGIIILCLLACLIIVLLSVLFVPVRYRAFGVHNEKETRIHVKITWFLHMITAVYDFPCPGELRVKLFGVPIRMRKKENDSAADKETGEKPESKMSPGSVSDTLPDDNKKVREAEAEDTGKAAGPEQEMNRPETQEGYANHQNTDREQEEKKPDRDEKAKDRRIPVFTKIKHRLLRLWRKIKYTIKSICVRIKKIAEDFQYYRELLLEEENRLLYGRSLARIGKVIKNIRPSKLEAQLLVGTGSPDTTGYLLAVYGMLLPFLGKHIDITPDFERPVLEGKFSIKGRITFFVLLVNGAGVYFDKQLHILIGRLKREDA